jgi:hypothetical protein
MKKFLFAILPVLLAPICSADVSISPINQQPAGSGCLHRDLRVCLDYLKTALRTDRWDLVESRLSDMEKLDVNGKRVGGTDITIFGKSPTTDEAVTISIEFSQSQIVGKIGGTLTSDPALASTEDDYNKTDLYEVSHILLGGDCPTLDKLQLYKFFHNEVRPQIKYGDSPTDFGDSYVRTGHGAYASNIPFCGKRFSYSHLIGVNTDLIGENNRTGDYSYLSISFQ